MEDLYEMICCAPSWERDELLSLVLQSKEMKGMVDKEVFLEIEKDDILEDILYKTDEEVFDEYVTAMDKAGTPVDIREALCDVREREYEHQDDEDGYDDDYDEYEYEN